MMCSVVENQILTLRSVIEGYNKVACSNNNPKSVGFRDYYLFKALIFRNSVIFVEN